MRLGARGWDNQLWRLGDDLAVRLPWATQDADDQLRKEHTWVPGEPADRAPVTRGAETGDALAAFLTALH
ncbi:hypothetical protein ACWEPL_10630 [Nonomuraea sp. NPDC004186]|uniref:hypothetical protein n=1 Tax=Nonomuraea sp. NPDC049625 TaxID=3155775 RepID=UPI003441E06E